MDLINRQDAIKAIEDLPNCYNGFSDTYDKAYIIGTLEELPSAERKGKWELAEDGWYCTACELYPPFDCDPEEKGIPYCPNCGSRNEVSEDAK